MKLEAGARVAVVGGGPAGSLFALYLQRYAGANGIGLEITIYQQRVFDQLGPKGCKGCAGILALSLLKNLGELDLTVPERLVQSRIDCYTVHSPYATISISSPAGQPPIVSVYRGGGSRISCHTSYEHISFDSWLLNAARERGIGIENETVQGIHIGEKARVEVAGRQLEYDLVVLATGVNARTLKLTGVEYTVPRTQVMAQDELYVGADRVLSSLGNSAHAFLIPHSGMIFGTLVPKGQYINVSVLSSGDRPVSVSSFLGHEIVRSVLPEHYERVCGCQPRAAVSAALNCYADRFVAIGDAVVSRLYKDGIGSALLTAREAARTAVYYGVSRSDFARFYRPFYTNIENDNRWGRLLFRMNDRSKDSRAFIWAQHRLISDEQHNVHHPQPFTRAAWGMFTGSYSYRDIARMVFSPPSFIRLLVALLGVVSSGVFHRPATAHRKLHIGAMKVLILGSGFGGTYVLRRLVPALNRNENVDTTMVSDENFFLFSPLLHEVAMARIETRHIAYPIRRLHWRDRFNFVQASVEKIDLPGRRVFTTAGAFDYDYLVLALGSVANVVETGDAAENVFTLKTLRDSMLIRNHIIGVFEKASIEKDPGRLQRLMTFIVSGAGYTGIQVVTELRDFVNDLARSYKTVDTGKIRTILVEAEPKIMAGLHTRLGAYAMRQLRAMNIETRLKSQVTCIREDYIEINQCEKVPAGTLIWVTGVIASPRIAEMDAAKDCIGRVMVNEYLEVPGHPGVYAVGDCAHFEDPRTGKPIPPRAHTAVRQAWVAAHNILAEIRGTDRKQYHYSDNAEMVSLGESRAVFRYRGLRFYGFPARFFWISGYSLLITGAYNRIRVLTDWLLSYIFGRDTTLLKLRETRCTGRPDFPRQQSDESR